AASRARSADLGLQRLTFRRGLIRSARFAPDGQSVVYGASWEGEPVRLFQARPGTPESRPLELGDSELLDLSSAGEMAVLLAGGGAPKRRVLSSGWTSLLGLAFAPSKKEVFYTAASGGMSRALYATPLSGGRTRPLARVIGQLILHDVAADGRVLVTHDAYQA